MLFRANPLGRRRLSLRSPSKDAISNRDQTQHQGSARTLCISSPERLHLPNTRRASSSLLLDPARTTIALKTNPSTLTLAGFGFLRQLATWRGRNLAAKIWSLSQRLSTTARRTCRNFSFTESLHLLRSPIAPVLTLPGDKHVHRQVPCTLISTSRDPSAATSVLAQAAGMEIDVPSLIEDQDYYPRPIVESKVWDSLSEHHRQLWKLEAQLIEKAPDDDDLDAES